MKNKIRYTVRSLGFDTKKHDKRFKCYLNGMKSMLSSFKAADKKILYAQQYNDAFNDIDIPELKQFDEIKRFDNKLGVAGSVNEILKDFYNSDDDFCIMSDDDTVISNNYGFDDFVQLLFRKECLDIFDLLYFKYSTVFFEKPSNLKNRNAVENYILFENSSSISGTLRIVKNIKKYYGKEIYTADKVKLEQFSNEVLDMHEDAYLKYLFVTNGLKSFISNYTITQCASASITNNFNYKPSIKIEEAMKYEDPVLRTQAFKQANLNEYMKPFLKKYRKNFNDGKYYILVNRPHKYEFQEKELTFRDHRDVTKIEDLSNKIYKNATYININW